MIVHQLIQGVEFDHPQEILPSSIPQHLKMLDPTSKSDEEGGERERERGNMPYVKDKGRIIISWHT